MCIMLLTVLKSRRRLFAAFNIELSIHFEFILLNTLPRSAIKCEN